MTTSGKYDIVYADPPWFYRANSKFGGAATHYDVMTDENLCALPVRNIMSDDSALFLWATCPRLDFAMDVIRSWGLHYRGVAYVWVKTRQDGVPLGPTGVSPAFVKPVSELVLVATTKQRGRVFPILDFRQRQIVFAPRQEHSRKPDVVRDNIVRLCGDRPRIELFARQRAFGWDSWGNEVSSDVFLR